jgi:hypothetical protein
MLKKIMKIIKKLICKMFGHKIKETDICFYCERCGKTHGSREVFFNSKKLEN